MTTGQTERLYYLDNLRIFCMIFGVYYHAAALGDFPFLDRMVKLSTVFRMEAFFLVAGYFTAVLTEKKELSLYLRQRTILLMVPFVATLLLINPVSIYISYGFNEGRSYGSYSLQTALQHTMDQEFGGPELHLWFLLVLLSYTYIFVLIRPFIKKVARWAENHFESPWLNPVTFALAYGVFWCAFSLSTRMFDYYRLIPPFVEDLPYFMVGTLAGYSGTVLKKSQQPSFVLVGLGIAGWMLLELYRGPGWGPIGQFGRGLLSVSLVVLMHWVFIRFFNKGSKVTSLLSSSIYTVYLFHVLILMLLIRLIEAHHGDLSLWLDLTFATIATVLGVLLHRYVIERFTLTKLLFLGKGPQGGALQAA